MQNDIVYQAKQYAIHCHTSTNHEYGEGEPYSIHLEMVYNVAKAFDDLIPGKDREDVLAACWTHDVIEDCRQTYNDVLKATNKQVADITYALTNEKGRNRAERGNDKYYQGIRETPYAAFVKLCDRIANYEYSMVKGSRMVKMYEQEMDEFISKVAVEKYKPLIDHLKSL